MIDHQEDTWYKHEDYAVRSDDAYAMSKYQIILRWLPQTEGLHVLNAGCGSGEMTALLAQHASWQVDAIDVDPQAILLSLALKERLGLPNVRIDQTEIETYTGGDYDIIVCNDVLEHLPSDRAAVARLTQMLKPNGCLCISVPALQWLFGYHDEELGHYRRYNRGQITNVLAPFVKIERCRYFGWALIPIALMYSRLLRKPYPVRESTGDSLRARILNAFLRLDRRIPFPFGTSVLVLARRAE